MEFKKELKEFLDISKQDSTAELECKVLSGTIRIKNEVDRLLKAIETVSAGPPTEQSFLRLGYPGDIRVEVQGSQLIQKICASNSFRGVPLLVQRKTPYHNQRNGKRDVLDDENMYTRFTFRKEESLRKDWDGSPNDARYVRLLNRKSFKTLDGLFQIDFSLVRSRAERQTIRQILLNDPTYELEIEFIKRDTTVKSEKIVDAYFKLVNLFLQAYQQSEFVLSKAEQEKYSKEWVESRNAGYNLVTMERRHLKKSRHFNILEGYTVTVKADGERSYLYVARDGRLLKISGKDTLRWTGIETKEKSYIGTCLDGEYIQDKKLFCIFDVYHYKGRDTTKLPLMTKDDELTETSRLGCAHLFVEDLNTHFTKKPSVEPMRIETKEFLSGDGAAMEQSINKVLDTQYEYHTDGLIFTPRESPVAPREERDGSTWTRVYKWKPASQNSIDFLLRMDASETYDPIQESRVKPGQLYVSRNQGDSYVNPCQIITGEYVPPELPADLQEMASKYPRVPALFQPPSPPDSEAYRIMVPLNDKGVPTDQDQTRIESNTIVECSYDLEKNYWKVMRTRYDKTYQYRVLRQPQFGNDIRVANNIWSSIHYPVTESAIRKCFSENDESLEEDTYYDDTTERENRLLQPSYKFHNAMKFRLYRSCVTEGDTLLEIAVGRGGDLAKWKVTKPSKVVGIDLSLSNLDSSRQGACVRYLGDIKKNPTEYRPDVLFVQGTMTQPLFEQESPYFKILSGTESAKTPYLEKFHGLTKFDDVSCQFAIHYACESEETFRVFAKNIQTHCKGKFFGTCLDGMAVYSLLKGKPIHIFTDGKNVGGSYTKEYPDTEMWEDKFGMPIMVTMESFDAPQREFLTPFDKITEIMKEYNFELEETQLFSELYSQQKAVQLDNLGKEFSFLNRTFVFKRVKSSEPAKVEKIVEEVKEEKEEEKEEEEKEVKEEKEEKEVKVLTEEKDDAKPEEEKPKTRKLNRKGGDPPEDVILFFGPGEDKGEYRAFSVMAEYPIEIEGVRYPTVEHYYQAMKASEFKDTESLKKILECKSTKAVKTLGKKVSNFMKEIWDDKRYDVMLRGMRAKFIQHPELRKQLLDTGSKRIGLANPRNKFWSIGSSVDSDKSKYPSKWSGQNKLGKMLESLRDELKD